MRTVSAGVHTTLSVTCVLQEQHKGLLAGARSYPRSRADKISFRCGDHGLRLVRACHHSHDKELFYRLAVAGIGAESPETDVESQRLTRDDGLPNLSLDGSRGRFRQR